MKLLEPKLVEKFKIIFKLKKNVSRKNLTQKKIKSWDSLNHVILLLSIQETFKVKFKISEYEQLNSFDNIINLIKKKLKKHR
tara:strand:- start:307 stop:552 length:246 start_codon:yes stop_codon:yes gene_type:complete